MSKSKFILVVIALLLFFSCKSYNRFSSKSHYDSEKIYSNPIDTSIVSTSNISDFDVSKYYDFSAKTIYPKTLTNKNSSKIILIAEKWLGVSYLYGGNTRAGVDCSGFVKNVFQELGVVLPRSSSEQFAFLKPTSVPFVGDLLFFKKNGRIFHVAIFMGNGKIIHSTQGKGVIIQALAGTKLENSIAGWRKAM